VEPTLGPDVATVRRPAPARAANDDGGSAAGAESRDAVTDHFRAGLYSRERAPRNIGAHELDALQLSSDDLLWIDLRAPTGELLASLFDTLSLPASLLRFCTGQADSPELRNVGGAFALRVVAAEFDERLALHATPLILVCATNVVVSMSPQPLAYVDALHEKHRHNHELGALDAESFAVALLDGHLATFHEAMSKLEAHVEKLEISILSRRYGDCLDQLRGLRKSASRLRRLLAAHRGVFAGLAGPDFRPTVGAHVDQHFIHLESRFERAMDLCEHGRDLVVGTFDLFTTRAAMSTNETMKVLTFVTVLIGGLAVLAGVLGMNFDAAFFGTKERGFWTAVAAMAVLALAALGLGKRRGWF
jgi:magnesium transporter